MTLTITTFTKKHSARIARVDGGQYMMFESGFGNEWTGRYVSDDGSVVEFGQGTRTELIARFNAHEAACAV